MPLAGTCLFFCPERERKERLLHRHLHPILERDTAALPLLKCYSRSAAGKEILASSVRPEAVLCGVVDHLLSAAVLCSPGVDPFDGFVADRLRAVRCDGCVQDLRSLAWGGALVRQVRYHLGMGYFLGGLGPQAEGGGALDAHTNSERTGEALGVARGVLLSLLEEAEGGGGGAAAAAAAEGAAGARLRALALEVHGYALVQALSQPAAVKALLAQAAPLLRAAPGSAREAWGALLPPCMAWLGGRWSQFIRLLEALPCAPAPVLFARCALHRLLPLARANLLQALNDALGVPRQALLPVPALQVALGFRGGGGGGRRRARVVSNCALFGAAGHGGQGGRGWRGAVPPGAPWGASPRRCSGRRAGGGCCPYRGAQQGLPPAVPGAGASSGAQGGCPQGPGCPGSPEGGCLPATRRRGGPQRWGAFRPHQPRALLNVFHTYILLFPAATPHTAHWHCDWQWQWRGAPSH